MSFHLVIPKQVQKELDRIDIRYKDRILGTLQSLKSDPFMGKKLNGEYQGYWSYPVWPYRIIYKIYKNDLVVLIVKIGHRQGIYK